MLLVPTFLSPYQHSSQTVPSLSVSHSLTHSLARSLDMKKDDSKSPGSDISGDIFGALTMLLTEVDDEAELLQDFPIKEEKVEEIMRELYKEISTTTPPQSKNFPSSLPLPTPSLSSSLPFDVNSESCGASVSDSGSTVMAGIEYVGPTRKMASGGGKVVGLSEKGSWGVGKGDDDDDGEGDNVVGEEMDGCDLLDVGDEWLARILRWGPTFEIEEEFS